VILGVRPEDISVAEAGQGDLNSTLYSLEPTGDQTLVAAFAGEQMVVAKGSRSFRQALETPISLVFDRARCYLFDAASGARI
jgi:multiple sugar transport system ATP-binding protein